MPLTTINAGKELQVAYRPVVFCDFAFGTPNPNPPPPFIGADGSGISLYVSSIAATFNGNTYDARISDEQIERLAALAEQGVDRIPSATITLADPSGSLWATYERDHGFRGATLTLRLALHDPSTGTFSTDGLVPFVGLCDSPACDEGSLTITASSKLNFTRFQFPIIPIQVRCPWLNPTTVAQRAEADDPNSPYYRCGEIRSLAAAPPCSYNKQTCTRPRRYAGSTWSPRTTGFGEEYVSGQWSSWRNADTSAKLQEFWPMSLGGVAWIQCVALNQFGDGNYTRGEAAVADGAVNVQMVKVNGFDLSYAGKDFFWGYSNNGARDGTPNHDISSHDDSDPYGSLTVIEYRLPKTNCAPDSTANIQVLCGPTSFQSVIAITTAEADNGTIHIHYGRAHLASDPGDKTVVVISGCSFLDANGTWTIGYTTGDDYVLVGSLANGSGTGGTLKYNRVGQSGGARTTDLIMNAVGKCGVSADETDGTSFATAGSICDVSITYTDAQGNSQTQARFSSAIAVRQRRSAAEIMRGLRQSIGAQLYVTQAGKIGIRMEGPLCEQQGTPVDGSNDNTAISSLPRVGGTSSGYTAYRFDESNMWNLKRSPQPISGSPNQVTFPFQDPTREFAISSFTFNDSDDVARIGYTTPGALQVQPEGIASVNHALRCAKLGLAKILRGNPASDTRGTDWWEWQASFRACKIRPGDIVTLNDSKYTLTNAQVRITEFKPSKDFSTITLKGHAHDDQWYLDAHGDAADPGYTPIGRQPMDATVPPTFAVEVSALDPTVAEVTGLTFSDLANTYSIQSGAWSFYYVIESDILTTLSAALGTGDSSISLASFAGIAEGDYLQIGKEIVKCGVPGATTPITRAQLGSPAVSAASGASVWLVLIKTRTTAFPLDFLNTPEAEDWVIMEPLPETKLLSVAGTITNAFGTSFPGYVCLTGAVDNGLRLTAAGSAGAAGLTTLNYTNVDATLPAGDIFVSVVATTRNCTMTLPTHSSDLVSGVASVVIIKRAAGSTFDVIALPNSGPADTIEFSTAGRHLTSDGETREYIPQ